MVRYGMKYYLKMLGICLFLLFVVPTTVKAGESVTGGDSIKNAVLVNCNQEYTTTNEAGWFKIEMPENTQYVGAGYDEFTKIVAYTADEDGLEYSYGTKLAEKSTWWKKETIGSAASDKYCYFNVTTSKADCCNFRFVCDVYSNSEKTIQLNTTYEEIRYVVGSSYSYSDNAAVVYYQFVAANTGNYKINLESRDTKVTGKITYKDGEYVDEVYCDKNQSNEIVISVKAGLTYKVEMILYREDTSTEPGRISFQISNAKVSDITLNANSLLMNKGEQIQLTASVAPENAVDKTITYSSSDPKVALVSEDGIVTAVRGGNTVITADANDGSGVQAMCSVTVTPTMVTRLDLEESYIEEDLANFDDDNYCYQLNATAYPTDADDTSVTYTSSNSSVVSVNSSTGMLTLKKPGTAVITCRTNDGSNLIKTCSIVLKQSRFAGDKKTIDGIKYKVTSDTIGGGTVTVYGVSNKNLKTYTIQNSVTIDGYSYQITGISNKAFKDCKKATSIILGKNIKTIGKEAFCNCKKLKTLTINSKKLKTVGNNAFKNVSAKAKIKVPSSKYSKYKKLISNKGQKKSVKVKKM